MDNNELVQKAFFEHSEVLNKTENILGEKLLIACNIVNEAISKGNKLILFGNGGSAGDAQHIAAEFTGRFVKERQALPAIALTTDTSAITAIGNDYGFDKIFERQVYALANKGDILLGISTSGNSDNVLNAFKAGKELGCINIGFSGRDGGKMYDLCNFNLIVPSNTTARIQEMHILMGHILCEIVDERIK